MAWINVRYQITKRPPEDAMRVYTLINLDHVRRVMRTSNGMARLLWAGRGDPITLDETYDDFTNRVKTLVIEGRRSAVDPPTDQPPTQGENP